MIDRDRDPGGWEYMDHHLKQMREFLIKDRADSVAQAEREADEAKTQGKERWSELWQDRAERLKAYRFHWEVEQEAAA
jgi:hypothetical protein